MERFGRCLPVIEGALDLIQRHSPAALDRIHSHFHGILVVGGLRHRRGHLDRHARLCVLAGQHMIDPVGSSEEVALTLVHEDMHALLHELGIPSGPRSRANAEVVCSLAELALARRLPAARHLVESLHSTIDDWASEWRSHSADVDSTYRADSLEDLRLAGAPPWLVRAIGWLGIASRSAA